MSKWIPAFKNLHLASSSQPPSNPLDPSAPHVASTSNVRETADDSGSSSSSSSEVLLTSRRGKIYLTSTPLTCSHEVFTRLRTPRSACRSQFLPSMHSGHSLLRYFQTWSLITYQRLGVTTTTRYSDLEARSQQNEGTNPRSPVILQQIFGPRPRWQVPVSTAKVHPSIDVLYVVDTSIEYHLALVRTPTQDFPLPLREHCS